MLFPYVIPLQFPAEKNIFVSQRVFKLHPEEFSCRQNGVRYTNNLWYKAMCHFFSYK